MYSLIPAKENHIEQIARLIAMTGYYNVGLKGNTLNLSPHEFICQIIAKPYLPITIVAIKGDDEDTIFGVIICANTTTISMLPDSGEYVNPAMIKLFENFYKFEIPDSYHIINLAVSPDIRGQGIGRKLFQFAEEEAKKGGLETISLIVINCQTDAIKLYLKMGMMIMKAITLPEALPFREFLYMEKNPEIMALHNYFETARFKGLQLM